MNPCMQGVSPGVGLVLVFYGFWCSFWGNSLGVISESLGVFEIDFGAGTTQGKCQFQVT